MAMAMAPAATLFASAEVNAAPGDPGEPVVIGVTGDFGWNHPTVLADHGELLGNHGLYLKHPIPYEDLLRIGMIVRGPGVVPGQVVREPVSTLDLAATFHDYSGVAPARALQGRSLRPLLEGRGETRDAAYSEWHVHPSRCGIAVKLRTVRTKTHKCTFELDSGAGELYDLVNDPEEMVNRFDDPAYLGHRKQLHELMLLRPGAVMDRLPEPIGMA